MARVRWTRRIACYQDVLQGTAVPGRVYEVPEAYAEESVAKGSAVRVPDATPTFEEEQLGARPDPPAGPHRIASVHHGPTAVIDAADDDEE